MAMDAPAPIRTFYDSMKSIDMESLLDHQAFIEPRKDWFDNRPNKKFKLRGGVSSALSLADTHIPSKGPVYTRSKSSQVHAGAPHASNVRTLILTRKPGLYLYPQFLRNHLVLKDLVDQLLHEELASPANSTNLHESYHITYPGRASDSRQQLSFFDSATSRLQMQPRLDDSWVHFPLTVTDFVDKLRWLRIRLPSNVKTLIESIIPLEVNSATALISPRMDSQGLRQDRENKGFFLDLSLGCDGVLVIGREQGPDERRKSDVPPSPPEVPEDNWHQWIVGLDDGDGEEHAKDDDKRNNEADPKAGVHEKDECGSTDGDGFHLAAIRLCHGDALLFSGESVSAWHGVARVMEGTFAAWEQDWPCWPRAREQRNGGCTSGFFPMREGTGRVLEGIGCAHDSRRPSPNPLRARRNEEIEGQDKWELRLRRPHALRPQDHRAITPIASRAPGVSIHLTSTHPSSATMLDVHMESGSACGESAMRHSTGGWMSSSNAPYTNATIGSSSTVSSGISASPSASIPLGTGLTTPSSSGLPSSSSSSYPSSNLLSSGGSASLSGTGLTTSSSTTLAPGAIPLGVSSISTEIGGSTTVLAIISGGEVSSAIILTPTTTIAPTGTEAASSRDQIETQLSSVFPIIQSWIDDDTEQVGPIITFLDDVVDDATGLLSKIQDDSGQSTNKDCTHSLFTLLSCIVETVTSIKTSITSTLVDNVNHELTELKDLTEEVKDEKDKTTTSAPSSTTSSASSKSSSSSCSSGTSATEEYFVTCTPTVISSTTTQICNTATSTVSGCSVSSSATTTTLSTGSLPICSASGCLSCTATSLPTQTTPQCTDCTTVDGVAYPSQATTLPKGAQEISDIDDLPTNKSSSKHKRTLQTPDDFEIMGSNQPYSDFFYNQLISPGTLIVPHRDEIRFLGSSSGLLLQGLYGCTSVIIVSRKAVYMNHLFENPGFMYGWDDQCEHYWPGDFTNQIENVLLNGDPIPIVDKGEDFDGQPWLPDISGLAATGALFDPEQEGGVRAIIVSPQPWPSQNSPKYRYQAEMETIRNKLGIFDPDPMDFIYQSTNPEMSNDVAFQVGKVLFQFDPAEATFFNKIQLGGDQYACPTQYAGFKLWIGYAEYVSNHIDPYYEDNWSFKLGDTVAPLPPGSGLMVSRDEEVPDACVNEDSSSTATESDSTTASITSTASSSTPTTLSTVVTTSSTNTTSMPTTTTTVASITSCTLSTQGATVLGAYTYSETTICACNDGWTAGLDTMDAGNGMSILTCAVGTSIPTNAIMPSITIITPPTTTTNTATTSHSTYVGACYTDTSSLQWGQCQFSDSSIPLAACPSSAPCPSNGAACYYVNEGNALQMGCGVSSPQATSTSSSASASASACVVPVGCTNASAPDGCAILCA
ncbi:hypothetical protein M409DRAFT_58064 [Zasmidium cellare ATCC 36951]|uniref:Alpha-ketoglutarate-dependent dioxygenase AlkB-like domain-containing protein n=1 Tax=Zasmidium cellare ATCC 36951 TaxID=1080233 RepID=A0A6A6C652_ZASCE|nr:uncharacterized protein M409DRAFT_58064 [Zasmidium cellare ATCC 36951]KAF2162647.1 hypothetical protein M409DRAFT_58064 [Zasmidium cellare ATCC 36951]